MECPKCHSVVDDNQTVCPKCHKVLLLECPNCHTLGESSVCAKCGYSILVKCAKCSRIVPTTAEVCPKCKFPTATSLAYQECETDEFTSIALKFSALRAIRRLLKSQELYSKFFFKLKNLLLAQIKGTDCKFIIFGDVFVVNMSKELSFATSSAKAVRLALRIVNVFSELNLKVIEELGTPLNLSITLLKKSSEDLQKFESHENNVKLLTTKKNTKKYLKGMQIVLDQYVCDEINKEYKTDSLYSIEENGQTLMFYEVLLDSYVIPPSNTETESAPAVSRHEIKKVSKTDEQDIYSFKVFDIEAKCKFERVSTSSLLERMLLLDFEKKDKIISIRSDDDIQIGTAHLRNFFEDRDFRVLYVPCSEQMNYRPWGFFESLFKSYWKFAFHNEFNDLSKIPEDLYKRFKELFDLVYSKPVKAMTPEDARFAYMEYWGKFLRALDRTVIIADGFERLDDTTLQTLELYFDKFKNVKPVFVFTTSKEVSVHSKLKNLLRTDCYTEFTLHKTTTDSCLATFKSDATDFIQSFYFEKIKENFDGSLLYFENAVKYLEETGVLLDFDSKLIVKNKKSVILPSDLKGLYKARIKLFNKNPNVSLILAYLAILGGRVDEKTLVALGIKEVEAGEKTLVAAGLVNNQDGVLYLDNSKLVSAVIDSGLKKEASDFLCKTILSKLGKGLDSTTAFNVMGRLAFYKEEYLTLWKNSVFAMKTGDYDAYLKNCLGFLSIVEHISADIPSDVIEENKKDVYQNILMSLYSYSPSKIYFIENVLLMDAINEGDDEKIVKLSNLMLQGALISSNYSDALGLLHNILSRMQNPTLLVDGAVNTKFLLLSLVNIEILYNIGDFRACADLADEILDVLSPEVLDKVKPASFSVNLFVSHILETLRLSAFAKLYLQDSDLDEFLTKITESLSTDLPEKDCVFAIRDFLCGKVYATGNIEASSAFSKVVFLILQELSVLKDDYKRFAQNVYQAKLLATDIHARELELFCDLLIAYAYSKIGVTQKAEAIYSDVLKTAETSAMLTILCVAKYLIAKLKVSQSKPEEALLLVNDALALLQKHNNSSVVLYVLFEKLYIDIAKAQTLASVDTDSEERKLTPYKESLARILD